VSIEPAFLFAVKCTENCYVQAETAYWIPIGGDSLYQSNIWHNHVSINKILCKPCHDFQLVGTLEFNDYQVFQGSYSSAYILVGGVAPLAHSGTANIFSMGPGLRLFICDRFDIGVGSAFAMTGDHFAQEIIRTDFRWRF
jgi:hypothetical protein